MPGASHGMPAPLSFRPPKQENGPAQDVGRPHKWSQHPAHSQSEHSLQNPVARRMAVFPYHPAVLLARRRKSAGLFLACKKAVFSRSDRAPILIFSARCPRQRRQTCPATFPAMHRPTLENPAIRLLYRSCHGKRNPARTIRRGDDGS